LIAVIELPQILLTEITKGIHMSHKLYKSWCLARKTAIDEGLMA